MTTTQTHRVQERVYTMIDKVSKQGSGMCTEVVRALEEDPRTQGIVERLGKQVAVDVAKTRLPGIGAFTLTEKVSQRAFDKMQTGDGLGAVGDYAAVAAIGAVSWIPFGGDAMISLLRAGGVQLEQAPMVTAVNTVTGLNTLCNVADAQVRVQTRLQKAIAPRLEDLQILEQKLSINERKAVLKVMERVHDAYQAQHADEAVLGNMPVHRIPNQAGREIHPHERR